MLRLPALRLIAGGQTRTMPYERPCPKWKMGVPVKKRWERPGLPVVAFGLICMSKRFTRFEYESEYHVTVRRPAGLATPKRISAIAAPPACPGYPHHRMAPILSSPLAALKSTGPPLMTTITTGIPLRPAALDTEAIYAS
eukprot:scaffold110906_cov33-Tisochrysis_lutea.AAC.2